MQCIRYQALHKGFTECLQHSLATMDQYNCKQFILYYDLSDYPEEQMQFMYGSFREYWWSHSGEYKRLSHTKIDELTEHVDSLVNVLKEKQ